MQYDTQLPNVFVFGHFKIFVTLISTYIYLMMRDLYLNWNFVSFYYWVLIMSDLKHKIHTSFLFYPVIGQL